MTTGGIRRRPVASQVLASGVAVIGLATAQALSPDLPGEWLKGKDTEVELPNVQWKDQTMAALATMALVKRHLRALGSGNKGNRMYSPFFTLVLDQMRTRSLTRRYRSWRLLAEVMTQELTAADL